MLLLNQADKYIKSCFNYTGGKYRLLNQINPMFPKQVNIFVDLFCGGANVGLNATSQKEIICVDKQKEVIRFFNSLRGMEKSEVFSKIEFIINEFGLSDTNKFGYEAYNCNSNDGLSSFNKEKFIELRNNYNNRVEDNSFYDLMFFILTVYGFNNQIRFNRAGNYNIPVGKRDFNAQIRSNLIEVINTIKEKNIKFLEMDFRSLDIEILREGDFVYADPPYLISTATYNEQNGWTEKEEIDLLNFLNTLNKKGVKFALSNVIEHKGSRNEILIDWLNESNSYFINYLDYNYKNSNYQIKHKQSKTIEVLVTNYKLT